MAMMEFVLGSAMIREITEVDSVLDELEENRAVAVPVLVPVAFAPPFKILSRSLAIS
jgi:hypothetical protein